MTVRPGHKCALADQAFHETVIAVVIRRLIDHDRIIRNDYRGRYITGSRHRRVLNRCRAAATSPQNTTKDRVNEPTNRAKMIEHGVQHCVHNPALANDGGQHATKRTVFTKNRVQRPAQNPVIADNRVENAVNNTLFAKDRIKGGFKRPAFAQQRIEYAINNSALTEQRVEYRLNHATLAEQRV